LGKGTNGCKSKVAWKKWYLLAEVVDASLCSQLGLGILIINIVIINTPPATLLEVSYSIAKDQLLYDNDIVLSKPCITLCSHQTY